jgi:hypothetical protein
MMMMINDKEPDLDDDDDMRNDEPHQLPGVGVSVRVIPELTGARAARTSPSPGWQR